MLWFIILNFEHITIIKIHVRRAAGRGYSLIHSYICGFVAFRVCTGRPDQTKNDTEIWYPDSLRLYLKIFFFEIVTLRAARLAKLTYHADFTHISSIALFSYYLDPKTNNLKPPLDMIIHHAISV